jgi:HD-like signal output (HDOD) protein
MPRKSIQSPETGVPDVRIVAGGAIVAKSHAFGHPGNCIILLSPQENQDSAVTAMKGFDDTPSNRQIVGIVAKRTGNFMQHASSGYAPGNNAANAALVNEKLMESIREDKSLPALGRAVAEVLRLASGGDEAVGDLARFILSDVALTQKILRLANTVVCRAASGTQVTTVSRAIFLLGFDVIVTSAAALLLVDRLSNRHHAISVRKELGQALYASSIARMLARRTHFKDAEEAAVAALFRNLGRILVAAHDHTAFAEIDALQRQQLMTPSQAAVEVIDCTFESMGLSVLREWQIPESTIGAAMSPHQSRPKSIKTRHDWLQQVVQFSTETARIAAAPPEARSESGRLLLARFGGSLNVDEPQWIELMARAADETSALMMQMESSPGGLAVAAEESDGGNMPFSPDLLFTAADPNGLQVASRFPSGKPSNARDLLLAGVQDITQMMASGRCKASDLMLIVLETLCKSMGFRFATVCLIDAQAGQFRARIAIGEQHASRRSGFTFAATSAHDLFHLSLENDVDLLIADSSQQKIRDLLPAWHKTLFADTRSFIVLPLVVQGKKLGLFYADRTMPAPEGVPADETSLIKTLKGQVLTALQTR